MNSWERFDETSLPDKKYFDSGLYLKDITDEDHVHAQKEFEELKLKNLISLFVTYKIKKTMFFT